MEKTDAQLTTQITSDIKDNGATSLSKTLGIKLRTLFLDLKDSVFLKKSATIKAITSNTFSLDFDAMAGGSRNPDLITASAINIIANPAPLLGKCVVVYHKASAEPTYNLPVGWNLVRIVGGKAYTNNAVNELTFQYLGSNLVKLIITELTIVP